MTNANININYTGTHSVDDSIWVRLAQANLPKNDGLGNLDDILNMNALQRARVSAFSYRADDDVYFSDDGNIIHIPLLFLVFPSSLDVSYSLVIQDPGVITSRRVTFPKKTQNVIVPMDNKVQMPYLIHSALLEWETPCYDTAGNVTPTPNYTISGDTLYFEKTVFGVLRGTFTFAGYEHTATLTFRKHETVQRLETIIQVQQPITQQTNKITNVECTIVCKYLDGNGEEQEEILELQIPKSVALYLESCPDDPGDTKIKWPDEKEGCHTTYYYSVCSGDIIDTIRKGSCNLFD